MRKSKDLMAIGTVVAASALFAGLAVAAPQSLARETWQTGAGAWEMGRQCYDPTSTDPNYIIVICTRVIETTSMNDEPFAYGTRAVAYMRLGKFDLAVDDLDTAIDLAPKNYKYTGDYYSYRCLAKLDLKQLQNAIDDCTASLELNPHDPRAHDFRGDAEYMMRNYRAAIDDFTTAIAADPKQTGALYVRGLARIHAGDGVGGQADVDAAKAADANVAAGYVGFDKQK